MLYARQGAPRLTTAPEMPVADQAHFEEVRVAMALNGGVSLAVWMGGCAVELDCARRAHGGIESLGIDSVPGKPRRVARRVRQFLTGKGPSPTVASPTPPPRAVYHALSEAFRRKLVIDVMSGASAGGINGALLAAAMCSGRRLHPDFIRRQWLDLGDFGGLLYPTTTAAPRALMQGETFYADLLKAFSALLPEASAEPDRLVAPASSQSEPERLVPKLDITTTDVIGTPRTFLDAWGGTLEAREYRARFCFREPEHFKATLLAQAARSSASFPLAFEPWLVSAKAGALAGFDEPRWVVDGGLLDNAPIRAALDLIPSEPAEGQVSRVVCYINADPVAPPRVPPGVEGPAIQAVVGYVATLPRKAPFIEQLEAIERATRLARIGADAGIELIRLDGDLVVPAAVALLPAYRRRRRLLSLEELLAQPSEAATAFDRLEGRAEVPWIPDRFPPEPGTWRWGIRAAQRVVYLLLDVVRRAADRAVPEKRAPLLQAKAALGEQAELLEGAHRRLVGDQGVRTALKELLEPNADPARVVAELEQKMVGYDCEVLIRLRAAADVALKAGESVLDALDDERLCTALLGPGWRDAGNLDEARFHYVLTHALAIEVIHRAFFADEDIESGQQLRFAQLTPFTPCRIFTDMPFAQTGWATPEDKLTGTKLGHFAAFYRRSWRANDFMWGRLDAAARVVEMLVDHVRATELAELGDRQPWEILADALVPDHATPEQLWLIREALVREGGEVEGSTGTRESLHRALVEALRRDLREGEPGRQPGELTRIVCARAAQLEILAHELPILDAEAKADTKLGAGSAPLDLPTDLRAAIENLRPPAARLPERLGRNRGELGSSLALRTVMHAALVTLAALRTAKVPLTGVLFGIRAALLPIAGTVSRVPLYRFGVFVGFWASALYLGARMLTLDGAAPARIGALTARDTVVALLAALVVIGVSAVPLIRALQPQLQSKRWLRSGAQLACFLVLLGSGGGAAVLIAWLHARHVNWADVLVAPGSSHHPPGAVLGVAIALLVGPAALGLLPFARGALGGFLAKPWGGGIGFVALMALAVLVGGWSVPPITDALDDSFLRVITAGLALFAAPVVVLLYLFLRNPLRRR